MDTETNAVTLEMVDVMIRVRNGVNFLEKHAPHDWRERLGKAIRGYNFRMLSSDCDVLAVCFKETIFRKSIAYGERAHAIEVKDLRKEHLMRGDSGHVQRLLGQLMFAKTRTHLNWHDMGFSGHSVEDDKNLEQAWRRLFK